MKLAQIASECSTNIEEDYRDRSPTQWTDYLERAEIKDFIISRFSYSQNYSNESEIGQSNNLEHFRSGESDIDKVQGIENGQGAFIYV